VTENTIAINVHDTDHLDGCRFIEEDGFEHTLVTFDEEGPISVVGPWGNDWIFIDPTTFESEHQDWYDEFYQIIHGDPELECVDGEGVDSYGDGCEWYFENPASCGDYDHEEFSANDECCACEG